MKNPSIGFEFIFGYNFTMFRRINDLTIYPNIAYNAILSAKFHRRPKHIS